MATSERPTVVGIFAERQQAEKAMADLLRAGFPPDRIGIALRDRETPGVAPPSGETETRGEKVAEAGLLTGGALGSLVGAALATGLIPGIGPVIAGGLLAGMVTGTTVGALAGGCLGALVGMEVPEEEARHYDREFQAGRTVVTVRPEGRGPEVLAILRRHGAQDLYSPAPAGDVKS